LFDLGRFLKKNGSIFEEIDDSVALFFEGYLVAEKVTFLLGETIY